MTSSFQLADCRSLLVDACHTVVYDLVSPVIRSSGHMNLDAVAKRISDISRSHLPVLDCLAEGMSNSQIAVKLGYKNQKCVATIIYDICKTLGLDEVHSRTEKRQLVADAFRQARTDIRRIIVSADIIETKDERYIAIREQSASTLASLRRQGYEIASIEVILRKRPVLDC
jgi:hypothetical protein